jgi:hypothetical protein
MDFAEAVEFLKKFPTCHPKVFKGFVEWGIWDFETDGYVVLTDTTIARESNFNELEDYVENHNLTIGNHKDYFIICTSYQVTLNDNGEEKKNRHTNGLN